LVAQRWLTLYDTHRYLYMGELIGIVDSLENRLSKLLHKLEALQQANFKLEQELSGLKEEKQSAQNTVTDWEEKYMLGSNTDKTEAKLKINALIRELDLCIAHLAE